MVLHNIKLDNKFFFKDISKNIIFINLRIWIKTYYKKLW